MKAPQESYPAGYRFGDITIDVGRYQVRRNGQEVELGKLSFRLLLALAESAPQVVTPKELAERVWDGRFVSPPTIKQRIALLRKALGDDASRPKYIKAIRSRGYAIIPHVKSLHELPDTRRLRPALSRAAMVAIVVIGATILVRFILSPPSNTVSVAVLPFENHSPQPDKAFFASGLHQELLDQLGKIRGLNVISRASVMRFAESSDPLSDLANELNVDAVMEGSVNYEDGIIRISTRLVDPDSGTQLWSKPFERDFSDVFEIQREIAVAVSGAVSIRLGLGEQGEYPGAGTQNIEAYEAYLTGIDMLRQPQGQERASFFFKRATEIDADYAAAWAQLAFATVIRSYFAQPEGAREILDEALPYLRRASELDPRSARIAATLGFVHYSLFDWIGAENHFARAIQLDANHFSLNQHANFLVRAGRITAARSEFDAATSVEDSISAPGQLRRHVSVAKKQFGEARDLVAMDENESRRQYLLFNIALNEGKPESIKKAMSELISVQGETSPLLMLIQREFDFPDRALKTITAAYNDNDLQWPTKYFEIGLLAAYFGDPALAVESLAADVRLSTVRIWVLWYPLMAEVRKLPEFKALVTDLNLTDYWRAYGWPDTCAPLGEVDFRCW